MELDPKKLRRHAMELAHAFGIRLVLDKEQPPDLAFAFAPGLMICAKEITDETSYAVVLHEMGHILSPWGTLRQTIRAKKPAPGCHPRERHQYVNLMMEEERAAWEWARHYALAWTVPMQMVEQQAYGTYEQLRKTVR